MSRNCILFLAICPFLLLKLVYPAEVEANCAVQGDMYNYGYFCRVVNAIDLKDDDSLKINAHNANKITYLYINQNSLLGSIPNGIFRNFPNLEKLDISASGINVLQSDRFVNAEKLEFLNLDKNEIRIVPSKVFVGLPGVTFMIMNRNRIETIEDNAFDGMPILRQLDLVGNRIRHLSQLTFAGAINIKYLDLGSNQIETIEEGALNLPLLETLSLSGNKLKLLYDTLLIGAPNLRQAFFSENEIVHIGNVFRECHNLTFLSLSENPINDINLLALATLENFYILTLDATNYNFPPEIPSHSQTKSLLRFIKLGDNGLSNPDILNHLSMFGQLEVLNANNNSFTTINDVEKMKYYFPKLTQINFEDNKPPLCDWINDNQKWLQNIQVWSGSADDLCGSADYKREDLFSLLY